ncbi:hypothetical protein PCANC_01884 [Puccinia coronata f. sp. avenae]|uniref:Uncharacterized protein n=1 Tax=Puccinia coronata f. sp. avenae TaxID=200324 RepID=A0A2N5W4I5_9BASI|nr:hypothetical protein PCANC_01884 [Puccinia coronata f. sp. avenae]
MTHHGSPALREPMASRCVLLAKRSKQGGTYLPGARGKQQAGTYLLTGTSRTYVIILFLALPALTGRTRQFERCSNSRVRLVVGQALSDRSTCRRVGQACPISSWDRSHRTSRDRSDKSVRPVGSCFGRTVPVRPPVEHGCSSTAQTAVFDRLMPAVWRTGSSSLPAGLSRLRF